MRAAASWAGQPKRRPRPLPVPAANRWAWVLRVRPGALGAALKVLLGVRRRWVRTPRAVMFADPASNFGAALFRDGTYERGMVALLDERLGPGSVFVDVGANEGWFSVLGSRLAGPEGRVLAIEPQQRLQPILSLNLRANWCENVTVVAAAAGSQAGEITLHLMPSINTGATSAARRPVRYPLRRQGAAVVTLAALFEQHGITHCDLAKVDVEGFEWEVLLGAEPLLAAGRIAAIALEYHPGILARTGNSEARIHAWLESLGYAAVSGAPTTLYVRS